jgi:CheY-like chemotaxis protein
MRGHAVVATGNGREVLALLAKQPFDVVLMDVQMPEMDGLETTAAIRDKEKGTGLHLPVVAMTAHAMKGDRERCLEAGMDNYVAKPLQVKELLAVIEGLVPPSAGGEVSVPAAQCDREVLDREALLSYVGGDRELLRELTDLFLESCSRLLSKLREALARGESKALGEATHALKGAVSSFCARAPGRQCSDWRRSYASATLPGPKRPSRPLKERSPASPQRSPGWARRRRRDSIHRPRRRATSGDFRAAQPQPGASDICARFETPISLPNRLGIGIPDLVRISSGRCRAESAQQTGRFLPKAKVTSA